MLKRLDPALRLVLETLGIGESHLAGRRLKPFSQARRLVPVGLGTDGRDKLLAPAAAAAWLRMRQQAQGNGVELLLVSAFRSVEFQALLIRQKLARGLTLDDILRVNAPPGYSEHHSGAAVDVGTIACAALDEAFEQTQAFSWLQRHAGGFGFSMSYPRDNPEGFLYEPWHWRHRNS